ncbi:hypothetical protein B0H14DRAFT_2559484 [Mycena olivaceomarginata]|nr:hypothetical protein B0H14DRAFT_2559484 [Mycena olivaceomarginata]
MSNDSFDQTVCTPEQLAHSGSSGFYCYTRRQNVGLVHVWSHPGSRAQPTYSHCLMDPKLQRNIIRIRKLSTSDRPRVVQVPMDLLMVGSSATRFILGLTSKQLSLFLGDLFQSLGVVMDLRWINDGIVRVGDLCTAQGVLQNIGQAAIAMTTFRHGGVKSLKLASILVGTIWLFLVLAVSISVSVKRNPAFYGPTPVGEFLNFTNVQILICEQYWCWINSSYPNYCTALENFWLWIAFAVSVLYVPLFFWDTGRITPGDPKWWTFKVTSLARWFLVVHGDVKSIATAEAQFIIKGIFSLSGVCDVIAFKFARSGLLGFSFSGPVESSAAPTQAELSQSSDDGRSSDIEPHRKTPGDAVDNTVLSRRDWRFLLAWVAVNILDAIWITYYIRSAADPNPRSAVTAGWQPK